MGDKGLCNGMRENMLEIGIDGKELCIEVEPVTQYIDAKGLCRGMTKNEGN